jgi:hypothetical protein
LRNPTIVAISRSRRLEEHSRHLGDQLGKGFSVANLRYFCQFYLHLPVPESIRYALRSELSRSHNRLIMQENPNH